MLSNKKDFVAKKKDFLTQKKVCLRTQNKPAANSHGKVSWKIAAANYHGKKLRQILTAILTAKSCDKFPRQISIRGHKGENSAETQCRGFLVLESLYRDFSAMESRCRGFLVLESRCRGFPALESRCRGFSALESQCRGFLVLESWCRGFLVLESRCHRICASTALFSFLQNLLCHIIEVDMWVVNWCKLFCIS